jgi:hypothetical protein
MEAEKKIVLSVMFLGLKTHASYPTYPKHLISDIFKARVYWCLCDKTI